MKYIQENLGKVRGRIVSAAQKAGRDPQNIKLIAVSKTFPAEAVQGAYDAGQRLFGENKVQDLALKNAALPKDIEWHMIGHLQSNKAKLAVENADYIHAVDSVKLLQRIDRLAGELGRSPKIFLEINVSGEESKFGADAELLKELAQASLKCENITVAGLMTMAPFGVSESELRFVFSSLRKLRENLEAEFSLDLPELSMGMSSDFEIAIEEGATMVRVGTSIFGKR
ncbi:MAG: YggS family pyridoxal phosphate-dependent enzyme [Victivallaceae bacterium]|nr:YggS family pyridoxal phosphate-dependent enzyme [Victivallaceae bacterium]